MKELLQNNVFSERCFIDGKWVPADSGATFPVVNPATQEVIGSIPRMDTAETQAAIRAASAAFPTWSKKTAQERSDVLLRWYHLMMESREELAHFLTCEHGKPLAEARAEIAYAASFLRFYAEEARRVYGETIPAHRTDTRIMVLKQPIGVVAAITPWNFPSAMITRKAAPALAAGCTMVLKPAEQTPFSALAIAALAEQAGLPAGVLNILTGDPVKIGQELCSNPLVRMLSFTGSTEVGKLLTQQCSNTLKKLTLELGGNAPFIVFEDADLAAAVDGAILSKYRHSGQTCVCTNRFLIQDSIYDAFVERFVERVGKLRVGNGLEAGVEIGPLIDEQAIAKVQTHVEDAISKGASLLLGGHPHRLRGTFFEPTVLGDATPSMRIATEETFGPVAALFRFTTEEEAIALSNDTEYGLAGYFYSKDLARSWRVAEALECGMVGINSGFLSVEIAPFGGVKRSGLGREGSHHGIEEFLNLKYLCLGEIA
ncbi:NAD-dependent succinate-semialdehyde dehydrogenase [Ktedonosporobacter rubrisoli]|uniref:NAD-dependent succinate-semialdehyde dehydrogenase n=1 Tax=Ktedonosporobacter rubrisoli TaxID=2509675 RepID=A0A4P6JL75_KTERU|nr:NAD-dependent succinate-semialdehyde dehydrogenase [Ktedonosporobacter rubrisoli]QBD75949.1 NAD-dependent succinate-semialdehyde dehydrogenase [Ktedonosporobacter rubrisoli]